MSSASSLISLRSDSMRSMAGAGAADAIVGVDTDDWVPALGDAARGSTEHNFFFSGSPDSPSSASES